MRTCCSLLKLSYSSLLASETWFLASRTAPLCTTGVEFELSWSFLPNFAGTVEFVAKILVGMVSLCIFGVVQDWNCLIDSLVIWRSHVTCVFIANASYMAFIYMYISLVCLYMVFNYSNVECTCLCIACALHPLSTSIVHHMQPSHTWLTGFFQSSKILLVLYSC